MQTFIMKMSDKAVFILGGVEHNQQRKSETCIVPENDHILFQFSFTLEFLSVFVVIFKVDLSFASYAGKKNCLEERFVFLTYFYWCLIHWPWSGKHHRCLVSQLGISSAVSQSLSLIPSGQNLDESTFSTSSPKQLRKCKLCAMRACPYYYTTLNPPPTLPIQNSLLAQCLFVEWMNG